jgi:hypothetical protein
VEDNGRMGDQPTRPDISEPAEDLEYDLAHESRGRQGERSAPSRHQEATGALVATETPDSDGDYGYDLAHDLPKP